MPSFRLRLKRLRQSVLTNIPGARQLFKLLPEQAFHLCTHNVVGLEAERRVLERLYRVPAEKISVVPLGLPDVFSQAAPSDRSADYLITQGTITERKHSVALAELARRAQVPILFIGKPYTLTDPYWHRFQSLIDGRWVRHQEHVSDQTALIRLLQKARGFVLLSAIENWCLSAHEAAACGLPLLVPRMNWSLERFGDQARYFDALRSPANVAILQRFYEDSASLPVPQIRQWSWLEVAQQLTRVYEQVLAANRRD